MFEAQIVANVITCLEVGSEGRPRHVATVPVCPPHHPCPDRIYRGDPPSIDELINSCGLASVASLLGAVNANPDIFVWHIWENLRGPGGPDFFARTFGMSVDRFDGGIERQDTVFGSPNYSGGPYEHGIGRVVGTGGVSAAVGLFESAYNRALGPGSVPMRPVGGIRMAARAAELRRKFPGTYPEDPRECPHDPELPTFDGLPYIIDHFVPDEFPDPPETRPYAVVPIDLNFPFVSACSRDEVPIGGIGISVVAGGGGL